MWGRWLSAGCLRPARTPGRAPTNDPAKPDLLFRLVRPGGVCSPERAERDGHRAYRGLDHRNGDQRAGEGFRAGRQPKRELFDRNGQHWSILILPPGSRKMRRAGTARLAQGHTALPPGHPWSQARPAALAAMPVLLCTCRAARRGAGQAATAPNAAGLPPSRASGRCLMLWPGPSRGLACRQQAPLLRSYALRRDRPLPGTPAEMPHRRSPTSA